MPDNTVAMKQRMQSMQPKIVDQDTFSITVGNPQVRDELELMRASIETFIRQETKNSQARMALHLAKIEEKSTYNKRTHLQNMMQRNSYINQLVNELHLELQ